MGAQMARLRIPAFAFRLMPVLGMLLLWWAVASSGSVKPFLLPSPIVVAERIYRDIVSGIVFVNLGYTLYRALLGFSIAAVIGTTVGLLMVVSRTAKWFFDPIVSVGFPMPKISLLPIFILWFGLDDASKIAMIAAGCVFVITANAYAGGCGVERQFIWSASMLGANRTRVLIDVVLPAATPQILTGYQIALPISLIITLVTEMIMGGTGLGGQLLIASRYANSPAVFASIIEIAVAGAIVVSGMKAIRLRLLHWHEETAAAAN
jgi:ABC-type nitrate/sulfonate/bicarbonate transport system permease component